MPIGRIDIASLPGSSQCNLLCKTNQFYIIFRVNNLVLRLMKSTKELMKFFEDNEVKKEEMVILKLLILFTMRRFIEISLIYY